MAVPIVILTPTKAFGEWIHQALDEAGGYVPALAVTGPEAVELQKSIAPAIFVLDADFAETTLKQFVDALRSFNPDIKIVIIPSEKGRDEDSLAVLEADAYLGKPFYLPDLLENLERVIQQAGLQNIDRPPEKKTPAPKKSKTQSRTSIPPPPEWLQDVDLAAQHLTRLSLESTSQAALITRGDEIWAYAGELPQPAAKKLAASLATYWEDEGGDLARFIQLEETGEEHMMYATSLGGDFVLALVFDAATPFSKIRSQAGQLARALAAPVGDQPKEILQEDTAPAFEEPDEILASAPEPLLEDVPPSIPDDWLPGSSPSHGGEDFLEELISEEANFADSARFTEVDLEEESGEFLETDPAYDSTQIPDYQAETVASQADPAGSYSSNSTLTKSIAAGEDIKVESVSPALYNLTYACVLIPRFPEHHLTGMLASHLSDWVTQVCVAFGWRLEHLSLRPDYLQWIVNLPPTASPGHLMRIVREHTSRRLFLQFPRFDEENPSGDFWAPGYFILSSSKPPPARLINDFIHKTRQRQGLSRTR